MSKTKSALPKVFSVAQLLMHFENYDAQTQSKIFYTILTTLENKWRDRKSTHGAEIYEYIKDSLGYWFTQNEAGQITMHFNPNVRVLDNGKKLTFFLENQWLDCFGTLELLLPLADVTIAIQNN